MGAKYSLWRQQIRKHRVAAIITAFVVVVVIAFIFASYLIPGHWFDWTGFNGDKVIWQPTDINGTPLPIRLEEQQPAKSLWDWLGLLAVLAIPVVVALGVAWFTSVQQRRDQKFANERADNERGIAEDNQRETALQAYIDKISELLLKQHLGELLPNGKADIKYQQQQNGDIENELKPEYEAVRKIARVRTLTVLRRLDEERKVSVLKFLYESGLINKQASIVELSGADLSGANLGAPDLGKDFLEDFVPYQLTGVLSEANLSNVNLSKANLSEVSLREANLSEANLEEANLIGAIMPNVILVRANLSGADLRGNVMIEAILNDANLEEANLTRTILEKANLSGANLSKANLSGASLEGAIFSGANLSGANLSEANLSGANLGRNFFVGDANLSGANLSKANLKDATGITIEELEKQAKSLKGATMPDGSIHP